jgi:hypothetical protein
MFPDNVDELWDEDDVIFVDDMYFDEHSEEDLRNELAFLQEIKRLKEMGKYIFAFEQNYVF